MQVSLDGMTVEEKLQLMEQLWADLSQHYQHQAPEWHEKTLHQREQALKEGKEAFEPWENARARIEEAIR